MPEKAAQETVAALAQLFEPLRFPAPINSGRHDPGRALSGGWTQTCNLPDMTRAGPRMPIKIESPWRRKNL
jgi:hypothetical protein